MSLLNRKPIEPFSKTDPPGRAVGRCALLAAALTTALLTVLVGCGELPLFPGELSVSPEGLTIEEGARVTLTRTGGYEPITWSTPGSGSFDESTLEYTAPASVATNPLLLMITATDLAETRDSIEITVFKSFSISPMSATVEAGKTFDFSVAGGLAPYTFSVSPASSGSVSQVPLGSPDATYTAPAAPESGIPLTAVDAIGNIVEAEITVVAVGDLVVNPPSASLLVTQTQLFTVSGGIQPYSWSLLPGDGTLNTVSAASFEYTAPATATSEEVTVADSTAVQKTVVVPITVASTPLTLSPGKVTIKPGQRTEFTADGGVPDPGYGYTWTVEGAGTIDLSADGAHATYTAPAAPGATDIVKVSDSKNMFRKARVSIE